jgi:hypothetical protein
MICELDISKKSGSRLRLQTLRIVLADTYGEATSNVPCLEKIISPYQVAAALKPFRQHPVARRHPPEQLQWHPTNE